MPAFGLAKTEKGCWFLQGVLRMGQQVEIRPGIVTKDAEGRATCKPIFSRIVSLKAEQNDLQYAVPGGLIGVGTTVCSSLPSVPLVWVGD